MFETKSPKKQPRIVTALSWLVPLGAMLSFVLRLNLHDVADRDFLIGWAAIIVLVLAVWGYGRVFALPRLDQRESTTRTSFTPIPHGPFTGWNPRAVRQTAAAFVVFVVVGSSAGLLIELGQPVFGGVAAAIALLALPQVLAITLMLLIRGTLKVPNRNESI